MSTEISELKRDLLELIEYNQLYSNGYKATYMVDCKNKELVSNELEGIAAPVVSVDSNDITLCGYRGTSIVDIIQSLYKEANYDLETAENGVIVLKNFEDLGFIDLNEAKETLRQAKEESKKEVYFKYPGMDEETKTPTENLSSYIDYKSLKNDIGCNVCMDIAHGLMTPSSFYVLDEEGKESTLDTSKVTVILTGDFSKYDTIQYPMSLECRINQEYECDEFGTISSGERTRKRSRI